MNENVIEFTPNNQMFVMPSYTELAVPYERLPKPWKEIHDFLNSKGFTIAAEHLRDMMRFMTPDEFHRKWATKK